MKEKLNLKRIIEKLLDSLFDLEDESKIEIIESYKGKLEDPPNNIHTELDKNLIKLYQDFSHGFIIEWKADEDKNIIGRIDLSEMKYILADQKGVLYFDVDIENDADICYFRPIDRIANEAECGVFLHSERNKNLNCMYYHDTGSTEIHSLDLDFRGYIEMAYEAKVFYYWPRVLIDIQLNKERSVTTLFKQEMPKLFVDFSWEKFVAKYESLRLSKLK